MIIQKIITPRNETRYLLLDDDYQIVEPVHRYLKYMDSLGRSIFTLRTYCYGLKIYFEFLDAQGYNYLTLLGKGKKVSLLTDFIGFLKQWKYKDVPSIRVARSPRTINNIMAAVLGFYHFLEMNNEIPATGFFSGNKVRSGYKSMLSEMYMSQRVRASYFHLKEDDRKIETCSRQQVMQLIEACHYMRDQLLIMCMFEGGLRLGEALNLWVQDFKVWNNQLVLRQHEGNPYARIKNHSEATLDMPPYVMKFFCKYIVDEYPEGDYKYVFLNYKGIHRGQPLSEDTVEKKFEQLSKKCGFKVHPHMLRHSHATELIEVGNWDVLDVQTRLRHKHVQTTIDSYVKISDEYKKKKYAEFQKCLKKSQGSDKGDDQS